MCQKLTDNLFPRIQPGFLPLGNVFTFTGFNKRVLHAASAASFVILSECIARVVGYGSTRMTMMNKPAVDPLLTDVTGNIRVENDRPIR